VTVLVAKPSTSLATGSQAAVEITLATVKDAVTVPNSAVTTLTTGTASVEIIKNGKAIRTVVRTGAVGATTTQVTSGLTDGQEVVLADLSAALPSTSSTSSRFTSRSGGLTSSLTGSGGLGAAAGGGGPPG
jgi:trimeric autotransporter adhesin